jgi:excisionase family DNA binding protein
MNQDAPRLLKPLQFCERYNIGRTKMFEEIRTRRLKAVKVGRNTLIPSDAAEEWARSLPAPAVA